MLGPANTISVMRKMDRIDKEKQASPPEIPNSLSVDNPTVRVISRTQEVITASSHYQTSLKELYNQTGNPKWVLWQTVKTR